MRWLVKSALTLLFPRVEGLPGAADCELDDFLARFQAQAPGAVWLGVVAGALLFQLTPLFTIFVPLPAFLLPARWADRHAARIASSGPYLARQLIFLLKMPAGLAWGSHPAVRARLGLPPLPPDPGTWRTT